MICNNAAEFYAREERDAGMKEFYETLVAEAGSDFEDISDEGDQFQMSHKVHNILLYAPKNLESGAVTDVNLMTTIEEETPEIPDVPTEEVKEETVEEKAEIVEETTTEDDLGIPDVPTMDEVEHEEPAKEEKSEFEIPDIPIDVEKEED